MQYKLKVVFRHNVRVWASHVKSLRGAREPRCDLPWQALHRRSLGAEARDGETRRAFVHGKDGLRDAIHQRSPRTEFSAWGSVIGLTWMVVYRASWIPLRVYQVARLYRSRTLNRSIVLLGDGGFRSGSRPHPATPGHTRPHPTNRQN